MCRGRSIIRRQLASGSQLAGSKLRGTFNSSTNDNRSAEQFEEALAQSLERLLSQLSFIDSLASKARLCPTIMDIPCVDGAPAHLILLHVEIPDSSGSVDSQHRSPSAMADFPAQSQSFASTKASLTYVPMSFFEVSRALVYGLTDQYTRSVERDVERIFATSSRPAPFADPTSEGDDRNPCRNAPALISSFSLDTLSDINLTHGAALRNKCSFSSVRSWGSSAMTVLINTATSPFASTSKRRTIQSFSSADRTIASNYNINCNGSHMASPTAGPSSPRTFLPSIHSSSGVCAGQSPVGPRSSIIDGDGPIVSIVRAPFPQIHLPPPSQVATTTRSNTLGNRVGTDRGRPVSRYSYESLLTAHTPLFESMFPASPHDSFRRNEWKRSVGDGS